MPEVSRFFGIVIAMYYREHAPPHFHAQYEPLQELAVFRSFRLDSELNTLTWPTGADLAPEFLYETASRRPVSAGRD